MGIGIPASHTEQIDQVASRQGVREAVVYTFDALDWKYEEIDPDLYKVKLPSLGSSWGEILTVSLSTPGVVVVTSKCIFPTQIFDWGANRRNVKTFIDRFSIKELRDLKLGTHEHSHFDKKGNSPVERLINDQD